jgi:hypothetical protein
MTPTDYFYAAIKESPSCPKRIDKNRVRMKIRKFSPEDQETLFQICMGGKDFYQEFLHYTKI